MTSFFFVLRIALTWFFAILITGSMAGNLITSLFSFRLHAFDGGLLPLTGLLIAAYMASGAFSHLRRVRLLALEVNSATLSNRQRRQVAVPFEAGEAFDLLDAAIRELPGSDDIVSARDSLQVRAKVAHIAPYGSGAALRQYFAALVGSPRNQIMATVTPDGEAGSVMLLCEPERAAWSDWFLVDDGTNLENAEAIVRAITRRVAERRRGEQVAVRQSATEKELTQAKLSLLHAQVEPHFLYNTLASAQILTRTDPPGADAMLGNLIVYLRHSLPRTDDALSTLGAELERSRAYLDILKIRMGSRLNLQIEVPEQFMQARFPAMMMQTLVENAIKHGLEPKSGGGTVWILARAAGDAIAVTVADDGRGFSAEGGGTGIGLRNIRERLRLAYGDAAAFSIVANFPCGVAATITLPNSVAANATNAASAAKGDKHD
ncbi:MAG: histidine kinase [Pseudomonadota bacterium]